MLGRGLASLIPPSDDSQNPKPAPAQLPAAEPPKELPADFPEGEHPIVPVVAPAAAPAAPQLPEEPPVQLPAAGAATVLPVAQHEARAPFRDGIKKAESAKLKPDEFVFQIEVEKIRPNPQQPRKHFDQVALKELAASIREFGVLQPVVVTKIEKEVPGGTAVEYELIAGERRLMASKLLGLERIPAIVRNVNLERERLEMAMIENIQRENLNPVELARSLVRLQEEFRLTQREIAVRMSKSREAVANTMRLLDLPMNIQDALAKGAISESHGRLLLTLDDPGLQQKLFEDLIQNRLSTRELRMKTEAAQPRHGRRASLPAEVRALQERLSADLGAPVKIEQVGETGKITITYYSPEELQSIIEKLGSEDQTI